MVSTDESHRIGSAISPNLFHLGIGVFCNSPLALKILARCHFPCTYSASQEMIAKMVIIGVGESKGGCLATIARMIPATTATAIPAIKCRGDKGSSCAILSLWLWNCDSVETSFA